jgi:DNA polymerase-3 subunit gamma/tau
MTFYLKYRPQRLNELDLAAVREALTEVLKAKSLPHAWLFSGPKGTGKTSAARILAKAINCQKRHPPAGGAEPCQKCGSCIAVSSGRSLDIIEIDAASNRGIDDIRDLKEKIRLAPAQLKYKVYIIDEVHMLTAEAFNALLKTLEEPPEHAVFILATTEPAKLPETITSRCFLIPFNRASEAEIIRSLNRVIIGEHIKIAGGDLAAVARSSGASFRDAVKLLEQLSRTGKTVSHKRVTEILSSGLKEKNLDDWLILLYQGKAKEALVWLEQALAEGLEVRQFMVKAIDRLREVLLAKLGINTSTVPLADCDDQEKLKKLIWRLMTAAKEIKTAVIDSLPLELLIAETEEITATVPVPVTGLQLKKIQDKWGEILAAVKPLNHSLEALLKAARPAGYDGKNLTIEVYYRFHKDKLEEGRYCQMVETAAGKILSRPVKVKYFLGQKQSKNLLETATEIFGGEVSD